MTICPECGPVEHVAMPEDEAHCECSGGWVWFKSRELGCGLSFRACGCPCHAAGHPADRSPDDTRCKRRQEAGMPGGCDCVLDDSGNHVRRDGWTFFHGQWENACPCGCHI